VLGVVGGQIGRTSKGLEAFKASAMASVGGAGRGGGKRDGGKGEEGSLARRAWRQYLLQLQQHPLRTKMITAGCLAGVSDSVAQKLSGYQKIEKRRLLLKMVRTLPCI